MRSFLVKKINNFTKMLSLRAKVPNTYGARLYITRYILYTIYIIRPIIHYTICIILQHVIRYIHFTQHDTLYTHLTFSSKTPYVEGYVIIMQLRLSLYFLHWIKYNNFRNKQYCVDKQYGRFKQIFILFAY